MHLEVYDFFLDLFSAIFMCSRRKLGRRITSSICILIPGLCGFATVPLILYSMFEEGDIALVQQIIQSSRNLSVDMQNAKKIHEDPSTSKPLSIYNKCSQGFKGITVLQPMTFLRTLSAVHKILQETVSAMFQV